MWRLNNDQIALVEADVESARITLMHLSDELVDHICCEIEEQMEHGKPFEEAYRIVKEQTGIYTLKKIQEDTLYLINKKYAFMKTTMKITGNVSLVLVAAGTLFKIFYVQGASIILVLGFALLALIFFPSAIYMNYSEQKIKEKTVLNLAALLGGVSLMIGFLFKVMHWQGANMLLLIGWLVMLGVFLPLLLIVKLRETTTTRQKWIYSFGVLGLTVFEVSTMFKFFQWPGAAPLMLLGSILLVSVFLPMYTYMKFKESGKITGQFIYLIIICMYVISLTALIGLNGSAATHTTTQEAIPSSSIEAPEQPH
jgi:hypothetical protein